MYVELNVNNQGEISLNIDIWYVVITNSGLKSKSPEENTKQEQSKQIPLQKIIGMIK